MTDSTAPLLHAWRHPRAAAPPGWCIGRTDVAVDARRAKRLAHRIRLFARRHGLPRVVITSRLQRSRAVGRWLARWGWVHRVDGALDELDFGAWDGRPWSAVRVAEIDAWCRDFMQHAPGDGESVGALLQRVRGFDAGAARIVVTHGGWLSAAAWWAAHGSVPPTAERWPPAPAHGRHTPLVILSEAKDPVPDRELAAVQEVLR